MKRARDEWDRAAAGIRAPREADRLGATIVRLSGVPDGAGRIPAVVILPLRLFLGVTFLYAGLQKLTDPQFFSPTAPGFIGRQMSGFVHSGSPLTPLLTHLAIPHAAVFGALIAFCELWVGLSALLGLLTRLGALGGMAISLTLFLTATWSVRPYFLGADLPYALGWLTLLLAGPGRYSLDAYFLGAIRSRAHEQTTATRVSAAGGRRVPAGGPAPAASARADAVTRAAVVRALGTAAAVVVGGGVLGVIAKLRTPNRVFMGNTTALGGSARPGATPAAPAPTNAARGASGGTVAPTATAGASAGSAGGAGSAVPAGYTFLGNVKKMLPPNTAGQYTDPISGDPALLIHLPSGQFVAYDAVCTHAGCTVGYDPTQHDIVCPCHGAVYDPAHGAQVLAGPAPQPLPPLQVRVLPNGNAYAKARA